MLVLVDIKYTSKATQCIRSDHRDQLHVFQCYSYSLIADYFTDLHKANQLPVVYFKVTDDVSTTSRRFSLYNKNSFYCKGVPVYLSTPCCGHMLVALFFSCLICTLQYLSLISLGSAFSVQQMKHLTY